MDSSHEGTGDWCTYLVVGHSLEADLNLGFIGPGRKQIFLLEYVGTHNYP